MNGARDASQPQDPQHPAHDEPASPALPAAVPEAPSRRRFLGLGAAAGAAAAAALVPGRGAEAQVGQPPRRVAASRLPARLARVAPPPDMSALWRDPVARLVRRITLGASAAELARARKLGYARYLEEQLRPARLDDRAVAATVAQRYPALRMTPDQLYSANQTTVMYELQEAALYRAAFSTRQLQERMVEFWSDHFSVYYREVNYLKVADDQSVIRPHAMGKFRDLLRASAHSAAMMEYLDQTRSRRGSPNQNYVRELMELHTVGVNGGYTQQDVAELARVFTGWTIGGRGIFTYDATLHDFGAKTVMGVAIPASPAAGGLAGKHEGDQMLDVLARHPSTATYLATKLAHWFVQDDPPAALVQRAAAEFTRTNGDIPSVLRVLLAQPVLMAAPARYKRPFHYAVSAVRALGPTVTSMAPVRRLLDSLGHQLYVWETPDGYPDRTEFWAGLVLPRWTAATALANAASAELAVDVTPFLGATPEATAEQIAQRLFAGELSAAARARLADYVRPAPTSVPRVREAVALALSSPDFQWY